MEFIGIKRGKKRKRRRRCTNKTHRENLNVTRVEVGRKSRVHHLKKKSIQATMEAETFWKNYQAAHEWQKRHNATWWKTRCFALEHENHVLKETIRSLMRGRNDSHDLQKATSSDDKSSEKDADADANEHEHDVDDDFEFHLDENMMTFLAQSIRHKIELKTQRRNEDAAENSSENCDMKIEGGYSWFKKRKDDANLLYGCASSGVLAMEAALQTTVDTYVDKVKPQYWPNIPLRL